MDSSLWFMLFHLIGFGLLATLLVSGWVLHRQYAQADDVKSRLVVLSTARMIGLLSPLAIVIVLVTGIGNMHERGLGFFTASSELWLNIKILLFVIAAANGIVFGIRSKKRGMLLAGVARGDAPAGSDATLADMHRTAFVFYTLQTILLLSILVLTVWKPGRFGA